MGGGGNLILIKPKYLTDSLLFRHWNDKKTKVTLAELELRR